MFDILGAIALVVFILFGIYAVCDWYEIKIYNFLIFIVALVSVALLLGRGYMFFVKLIIGA